MKEANRRFGKREWLGLALTALSIALIWVIIDPEQLWRSLKSANYGYYGLSIVTYPLFLALRTIRWRFMLGDQVRFDQVWHIQNIGYMINYLLPARLGEVARAVLIGNIPPLTVTQGISTMVVERALDVLFMATLLPLTVSQVETLPEIIRRPALFAGIAGIVTLIVLIIMANQRENAGTWAATLLNRFPSLNADIWLTRLDNLLAGLSALTNWHDGATLLFWSVLLWIPVIFGYHWGMLAVGLDVNLLMSAFVVCVAAFTIAAPSSPGQVGVYHAGVIFALSGALGFNEEPAAAFAILYHAMNLILSVIFGLIALRSTQGTLGGILGSAREFAGERV